MQIFRILRIRKRYWSIWTKNTNFNKLQYQKVCKFCSWFLQNSPCRVLCFQWLQFNNCKIILQITEYENLGQACKNDFKTALKWSETTDLSSPERLLLSVCWVRVRHQGICQKNLVRRRLVAVEAQVHVSCGAGTETVPSFDNHLVLAQLGGCFRLATVIAARDLR